MGGEEEKKLFAIARRRAIDCGSAVIACADTHHARDVFNSFCDWAEVPKECRDYSGGPRVRWDNAHLRFVSVRSGQELDWNRLQFREDGRAVQTFVHPLAIAKQITALQAYLLRLA